MRKEKGMEDLRYYVQYAKIKRNWKYKDFAKYLQISDSSFYNWLNHQYELSRKKELELHILLQKLLLQQEENNEHI